MRIPTIVVALVAASTAAAQPVPRVVYSWSVTYGNLITPPTETTRGVFNPVAGANILGVGGATDARLRLSLHLEGVNPATGGPATLPDIISGGQGTFAGLAYTTFDMTTSSLVPSEGFLTRGWIIPAAFRAEPTSNAGVLPPGPGSVPNGVGGVRIAQSTLFPSITGTTLTDVWEIFWRGTSPTPLPNIRFDLSLPASAGTPAAGGSQAVLNMDPDPTGFTPGAALLATQYASVTVVRVPAPAASAVLAAGGLIAIRRRRTPAFWA